MDSSGSGEALTSERLAELRRVREMAQWNVLHGDQHWFATSVVDDYLAELETALAEVERQRAALAAAAAREAALVEMMQKAMPFLQELDTARVSMLDEDDVLIKVSPGRAAWVISRNHVFITQARALLASAASEQGEAFVCPGCGGRWRKDQLGPRPGILRCPNCGEFCKPEQGEA